MNQETLMTVVNILCFVVSTGCILSGFAHRHAAIGWWLVGLMFFGIGLSLLIGSYSALVAYLAPLAAILGVAIIGVFVVIAAKLVQRKSLIDPAIDIDARQKWNRARELLRAIDEALRSTPISSEQKSLIKQQSANIPKNIVKSAKRLRRLRKLKDLSSQMGKHDTELEAMEHSMVAVMDSSLDMLLSIPKALMKVETARDERAVTKLIEELRETNRHMLDLADAHTEVAESRLS
jgi:hypothetical protein